MSLCLKSYIPESETRLLTDLTSYSAFFDN